MCKGIVTHVTDIRPDQTASLPAYLPENLPDLRAAQRLLSLVDQLETLVRAGALAPAPKPTEPSVRIDPTLIAENTRLKSQQAKALARLDSLLARLDAQTKAELDDTTQEAA